MNVPIIMTVIIYFEYCFYIQKDQFHLNQIIDKLILILMKFSILKTITISNSLLQQVCLQLQKICTKFKYNSFITFTYFIQKITNCQLGMKFSSNVMTRSRSKYHLVENVAVQDNVQNQKGQVQQNIENEKVQVNQNDEQKIDYITIFQQSRSMIDSYPFTRCFFQPKVLIKLIHKTCKLKTKSKSKNYKKKTIQGLLFKRQQKCNENRQKMAQLLQNMEWYIKKIINNKQYIKSRTIKSTKISRYIIQFLIILFRCRSPELKITSKNKEQARKFVDEILISWIQQIEWRNANANSNSNEYSDGQSVGQLRYQNNKYVGPTVDSEDRHALMQIQSQLECSQSVWWKFLN